MDASHKTHQPHIKYRKKGYRDYRHTDYESLTSRANVRYNTANNASTFSILPTMCQILVVIQ